jgi:hypothetical protein
MTINEIIIVVTAFVTYVFGILAKRFNWIESQYIPVQNLAIGFFSGLLVYMSGLNDNPISSVIICCAAALTAGGAYDLGKAGKDDKR